MNAPEPGFPVGGPPRRVLDALVARTGGDSAGRVTRARLAADAGLAPASLDDAVATLARARLVGVHWSGNVHPTRYGLAQLALHLAQAGAETPGRR